MMFASGPEEEICIADFLDFLLSCPKFLQRSASFPLV